MDNNDIRELINISYRDHGLIQNPVEVYEFAKFYQELNCKNVLEIGTFFGGTFYLLCKLAKEEGKKISVDFPVDGYPGANTVKENLSTIVSKVKQFSKNVEVLTMDSHLKETVTAVENILAGEEVDFIFIDGDHTYEGVKQDYEMYKHLVKDGGYIAFHDINRQNRTSSESCTVDLFWEELLKDKNVKTFEFNQKSVGGIGVVQVFKHKRNLDFNVWFEAPNTIHIFNNSHHNEELLVSVRDKHTTIPIYFCDISFSAPGYSWYIQPIGGMNWLEEPFLGTFILEFYDKNKNFIDKKEVKVKDNFTKVDRIGTRIYSAFDCLWINYRQMFLEKIYDKFDIHNLNTVIDVGANVGIFTNYMTERGAKVVHAIEPTGKAFTELKKQFYYYNSVRCHKIGIGESNGTQTIYTNNENSTLSSFLSKTSGDVSEELIDLLTFETFYSQNKLDHVDLVKIDIEGMEYGILDSMSDDTILKCERYLIEYHMNEDGLKLNKMMNKLSRLGYDVTIHPDVPSNVQGHIFAKKTQKTKVLDTENKEIKFPKRAFVTFTNEYYLPITEKLVQSLQQNSSYPIIVYSVNCDVPYKYPNMFTKRIESDMTYTPKFQIEEKVTARKHEEMVEVVLPTDSMGIVDRNDLGTYITLSRKPLILLDALNNGVEEGIFLDADGIAKENIDTAFEYLNDATYYPLVGEGMFEFMMLNGKGDPFVGDTLEQPLMDLLGVSQRTMYYVATNFILFTDNMKPFIEEWAALADHPTILADNVKYAPYHDETLVNVLLWKHGATKKLPAVHYNLTNAQKAEEFYNSTIRDGITDSEWHYIPANIDDIKYFHGCKSLTEIDKTIKYIRSRKSTPTFNYHYKKFKFSSKPNIAIVTLFDTNYTNLANIAVPNHIEYAAKHGYDYIYFDETIDNSRPPQWSKVKAVEYLLNEYDWVWWIDVDALIINSDKRLEDIINPEYDMIFTANKYSVLSNGSSFYRSSRLTKSFLKECYTLERDILRNVNIQVFDHEQQPMRELYLNVPEYRDRIQLVHERVCNSFWYTDNQSALDAYPNWNKEDSIYQPGDFVVNFCGRTRDERVDVMNKFVNKLLP